MKLCIEGAPVTKKNSMKIIMVRGKMRLSQSDRYKAYAKLARYQLLPHRPVKPIDYPVNVRCVYYMPTNRRVDLTNLLAATLDILVDARILADDNAKIVVGHDGSRVVHKANKPRAEIEITDMSYEKSECQMRKDRVYKKLTAYCKRYDVCNVCPVVQTDLFDPPCRRKQICDMNIFQATYLLRCFEEEEERKKEELRNGNG